jgi:hypothetical protein
VGKWWANGGQMVGKWWANGGQMVGKWLANGGQMVGKWVRVTKIKSQTPIDFKRLKRASRTLEELNSILIL